MKLPGQLNEAIARWMAREGQGSLQEKSRNLSATYKAGKNSSEVSVAAYVATRVPATYATCSKVLAAANLALPGFKPLSLLDVGAGPGTASWAALAQWPEIVAVTQIEQDPSFGALAQALNAESGLDVLQQATLVRGTLQQHGNASDVVTASYVLAEIPMTAVVETANRLWTLAKRMLIVIEPGTPEGFARLKIIRQHLLRVGAHVAAPCTHAIACPLQERDWCHFKVRVQRSRAHMHAKQAVVPFEDEAYSYLVLVREPAKRGGARLIAPIVSTKSGIALQLCDATGVHKLIIARRDKATYKRAKRVEWGDHWVGVE